jgi:hypothetical protein
LLVVKKAAIGILALLYVISTSGVVVNVHYCMGALTSVSYGDTDAGRCGKCGMKQKSGCCHSELKLVKLNDVHQQTVKAEQTGPEALLPVAFFETAVALYNSHKDFVSSYHSPPDRRVNSVYLHNRVFRI